MSTPHRRSRSLAAIPFRVLPFALLRKLTRKLPSGLPPPVLMPVLMPVLLSATLLALAACSTPQERAAQAQAQVEHMMVVYGPACTRLGYTTGSDPWRSCVLTLSAKDDLQRYGSAPHYHAGYGMGRWPGGWWGPYW